MLFSSTCATNVLPKAGTIAEARFALILVSAGRDEALAGTSDTGWSTPAASRSCTTPPTQSATHTSLATIATARGRRNPRASSLDPSVAGSTRRTLPSHSHVTATHARSGDSASPYGPAHTLARATTRADRGSIATISPARPFATSTSPEASSSSACGSPPTSIVARTASVLGSSKLTLPWSGFTTATSPDASTAMLEETRPASPCEPASHAGARLSAAKRTRRPRVTAAG